MYRKMKDHFALRGWLGIPYGLVDGRNGRTSFLDAVSFQALGFCDGQVNLSSPLVLPAHREAIRKLEAAGIVEESLSETDISSWQKYRRSPGRFAASAHWSITGRCNFRCRHCYMSAPQEKYSELTTAQCLEIIEQIDAAGIGRVSLTGGEPLVRNDFLQLVDALCERHIVISQIYTNGMLVTDELLDELKSRGVSCSFSLSFDGCGCHDWMRGVDGAEEAALQAIRKIVGKGFEVGIETALYSGNIAHLEKTYELLHSFGVKFWKMSPAMNVGNWQQEQGKHDLSIKQLFETYLDMIRLHRKNEAPFGLMLGGLYYQSPGSKKYVIPYFKTDGTEAALQQVACRSCRVNIYIMADGKLLPCIPMTGSALEQDMPSVFETPIAQALAGSRFFDRIDTKVRDVFQNNEKCASCEHRLRCGGGCRACAMMIAGNYFAADPFSCYFFENGYEQIIRELLEMPKE